jgi:hypothetical protein
MIDSTDNTSLSGKSISKNLQNILGNTLEVEKYEIDIFQIEVIKLDNQINNLIFISK